LSFAPRSPACSLRPRAEWKLRATAGCGQEVIYLLIQTVNQ